MEFDRTGFILYTIKYIECVDFYENVIELKKIFETDSLSCFEFGASYLMVEIDDEYDKHHTEANRIKVCLRMNVANVKDFADKLTERNVSVAYQEHSWGTIAKFYDPDGNLCAFKDSEKFEQQIKNYSLD